MVEKSIEEIKFIFEKNLMKFLGVCSDLTIQPHR